MARKEYSQLYDKYWFPIFQKLQHETKLQDAPTDWLRVALRSVVGADDSATSDVNPKKAAKKLLRQVRKRVRSEDEDPQGVIKRFCGELDSLSSMKDVIRNMRRDRKGGRVHQDDLDQLCNKLYRVHPDWVHFGDQLMVPNATLRGIKLDHRNTLACFRQVLVYWLQTSLYPTWNDIINALRIPTVGHGELANKLERQFYPEAAYSGDSELEPDSESDSGDEREDTGIVSTSTSILQSLPLHLTVIEHNAQAILGTCRIISSTMQTTHMN